MRHFLSKQTTLARLKSIQKLLAGSFWGHSGWELCVFLCVFVCPPDGVTLDIASIQPFTVVAMLHRSLLLQPSGVFCSKTFSCSCAHITALLQQKTIPRALWIMKLLSDTPRSPSKQQVAISAKHFWPEITTRLLWMFDWQTRIFPKNTRTLQRGISYTRI